MAPYLVVLFNAKFEILNTIFFDGDFRLTATTNEINLSTSAELAFKFFGTEAFRMQGSFDLLISATQFRVAADASMSVGLLGSLDADGEFIIDSDGVRARIGVTGALGSDGIGLKLGTVSGALQLNTTSTDWPTTNELGAPIVIPDGSLAIAAAAGIDFVGLASGDGSFIVAFDGTGFQLALDGTLSAGTGLSFRIDAFVGVSPDGVVVSAGVLLNVGNIGGGFISGTLAGRLQINTTPNTATSYKCSRWYF